MQLTPLVAARRRDQMPASLCQAARSGPPRRFFLRARLAQRVPRPSGPDRFRHLPHRVRGRNCIARRTEFYRLVSDPADMTVKWRLGTLPAQFGFVLFSSLQLARGWRSRGAFLLVDAHSGEWN